MMDIFQRPDTHVIASGRDTVIWNMYPLSVGSRLRNERKGRTSLLDV